VLANHLTVSQVASRLGVSSDTVRRWIHSGRVNAVRDGDRFMIHVAEVGRLSAEGQVPTSNGAKRRSGSNRFTGIVSKVEDNGLMSQVEILVTDAVHLVATVTADAVEEMNLKPGMPVTAIFRATSPYLLPADEELPPEPT
jgi:molybdopterin-binding protein